MEGVGDCGAPRSYREVNWRLETNGLAKYLVFLVRGDRNNEDGVIGKIVEKDAIGRRGFLFSIRSPDLLAFWSLL